MQTRDQSTIGAVSKDKGAEFMSQGLAHLPMARTTQHQAHPSPGAAEQAVTTAVHGRGEKIFGPKVVHKTRSK